MTDAWKPVVGGRAMMPDGTLGVVLPTADFLLHMGTVRFVAVTDEKYAAPATMYVDAGSLREHPADRRHRELLDAAREYFEAIEANDAEVGRANNGGPSPSSAPMVRMLTKLAYLREIVAECDAEESTDAVRAEP